MLKKQQKTSDLNGGRSGKSEEQVLFELSDVLQEDPCIRYLPLGYFFSNLNSTNFSYHG